MVLLLIIISCFISYVITNSNSDHSDIFDAYDVFLYTKDLVQNFIGYNNNNCPYQDDIVSHIKKNLENHIKGQDEGVDYLVNAVASWDFLRDVGDSTDVHSSSHTGPLVLALTGPTGVGKSETAYRVAEAALAQSRRVGHSSRYLPNGLLVLRGEDFSAAATGSTALSTNMNSDTNGGVASAVLETRRIIQNRIADHLASCQGNAIIVFDEVQKVLPGTLEVLMPALDDHGGISITEYVPNNHQSSFHTASKAISDMGSYLTSYLSSSHDTATHNNINEMPSGDEDKSTMKMITKQYSTVNCIFIFISDIGSELMTKLLLTYGSREAIPKNILRNEVKTALDAQWNRLRFGKTIKEVVPFLPLEPAHIRMILASKIDKLSRRSAGTYWLQLIVDSDVVTYLTTSQFIKYSVYSTKRKRNSNNNESDATSLAAVNSDGTVETPAPAIDDRSNNNSSTKVFATWGARALENAGPLQDLRSLLYRKVHSWRPDEVLHVGLANEENRELWSRQWGVRGGDKYLQLPQLYIQWCQANANNTMTDITNGNESNSISDAVAFSSQCETVWFGKFQQTGTSN